MIIQNPNCDGGHCKSSTGQVKYLPISNNSGLILCKPCFENEIKWRKNRNRELEKQNRFNILTWERLEIYT